MLETPISGEAGPCNKSPSILPFQAAWPLQYHASHGSTVGPSISEILLSGEAVCQIVCGLVGLRTSWYPGWAERCEVEQFLAFVGNIEEDRSTPLNWDPILGGPGYF